MKRNAILVLFLFLANFCFGLTGARYLIITPDSYVSAIKPLADWKTKKGVLSKIVPLSVTGSSASQIRDYIVNAYNNWEIRPEYVLLAGFGTILPVSGSSDDYYANISGNYRIEICVGRLPFTNIDQCNLLVSKILGYEKTPYLGDTLWFRKGTTIMNEDNPPDAYYQADCRYMRSLMLANGFFLTESISDLYSHNSTTVMNAINDGRGYVAYRGQAVSQWYPPFNSIEPNSLTNGFKLPVIVSGTCVTMYLAQTGSYGDRFMLAGTAQAPKGSVAYFGTTGIGTSVYRSTASKAFFTAVFLERTYTLGNATKRAKFVLDSIYNNQTRYQEWNLFGDPAMELWTGTPKRMTIAHDTVINAIPQTFTVTVKLGSIPLAGAKVCIMMDTLIYQTNISNSSGIATFNIAPPSIGTMSVTVTAHNCIPYENNVTIRPGNLQHDVGVVSIIEPLGTIAVGINIVPKVKVKNYATNTDTFSVSLRIGSVYSETVNTIILNANDTMTLFFPNWITVGGTHNVVAFTSLDSDQYHANDTAYAIVNVVVPNDVGVDAILYPISSHPINTVMIPKARIKNYGSLGQTNFTATCSIVGMNSMVKYTNSQNINSLVPGDTVIINFSGWTPIVTEQCSVKMRTNLIGDENLPNDRKTQIVNIVNNYSQDFESGNGNFIADPLAGDWEWGIPSSGPGSAHTGTKLWATVLGGQYGNSANWTLTSVQFTATANNPTIRFWHWYEIESGWDGGNVKISTNGGSTWTIVTPVSGYPGTANGQNAGIPNEPCYTGTGTYWNEAVFNLSINSGQTFKIRWHFGSDNSVTYAGWYIDDILGSDFVPTTSVTEENLNSLNYITALSAPRPNPAKNLAKISFSLAVPQKVMLKIFDASGRIVKTLANSYFAPGFYSFTWNGKDDYEQQVAEGIYFYSLETPQQKYTKKLIFTR